MDETMRWDMDETMSSIAYALPTCGSDTARNDQSWWNWNLAYGWQYDNFSFSSEENQELAEALVPCICEIIEK